MFINVPRPQKNRKLHISFSETRTGLLGIAQRKKRSRRIRNKRRKKERRTSKPPDFPGYSMSSQRRRGSTEEEEEREHCRGGNWRSSRERRKGRERGGERSRNCY